jgi:sarcosine oxidase, subunit alpha
VRQYLHRYGVTAGANVLVATNNDDAWRTAFDLDDAGVAVAGIIDAREHPAEALLADADRRRLTVRTGAVVTTTRGDPGVRAAAVQELSPDGASVHGRARWITCDAIAMSAGWNPTVHLYSQAGGQVRYDERLGCVVPVQCRQRARVVGAANGEFAADAAVASGEEAGRAAASDAQVLAESSRYLSPPRQARTDRRGESFGVRTVRRAPIATTARQWVDFQHDVTVADIELAVRENYTSIEHLKRYTTLGMSVDQGKTSNLNALTLLAELTGRSAADVGTTTFRPQFLPVTMGAIGGSAHGEIYAPTRRLPLHERHEVLRAEFDDYGGWRRPALYVRVGEAREQSIEREMLTARRALALFDASPLGKIEIRGPDAAEFVDRLYVNNMRSLLPGRVRYGLMLNENGIVIDDGICARLAADHFLVGTTSGGAERIAAWLEDWHQGEWPDLRLVMLPVTTQWAVVNIVGQQARCVLQQLKGDIDFSSTAFPHLHVRTGQLEGDVARVQRVSFCGELSYEIAVAAQRAEGLWTKLMTLGAAHGIEPIGVEAWVRLRIEKGFLHVGSDTDGTTNPLDLGLGPLVDRKPGDFIGRRSLLRPHDRRGDRRQFVGIEPIDESAVFAAGAHIVTGDGDSRRSEGFVTSACRSPILGRSVGLALLERGSARLGQQVTIFDAGRTAMARIVTPSFYDPTGARMNG